ncbi:MULTISPECIES: sigma-70 family RNA polymerase sigma factor [unclassified Luteimonas]|uniref:RNA polymerase sigma factor n=1 Tax=unclassified Luteimonas TaxID=2629088 RepID=UPI0018F0BB61|nr:MULTISPECIES: sigma-70 family RNA polymerase sigma factor [unclassified Luteimonas]MBJ6982526.1 sigma-70 family RNA polymerase sigma factor [Luteimonas sp. MC1572]MBJ7574896.1 sigma-70 family RNA polymerase sigma factor [Luteimonas sp. MC1828]QQO03778.1 sigma-70 family RNA polymerase sigma factor [Luteimonas sp. MC1572]
MSTTAIDALIHRDLPAAANGCEHAYGRIIVASQNTVTAVALAITRDVTASEDIAQEAFLSAWQNLKRLQNPASFLPWLRQITRNLAYDHLRSQRNRNVHGEAAELAIAHAADPSALPDERLLDAEREQLAADLISELPEESREVLLLYYREGQNSRQVASLLGLSDAAVRKRLSRARKSVRADLIGRFSEFARGSAPGTAFAVGVVALLGVARPAAATGFAKAAPAVLGGLLGKSVLGTAGALGGGLLATLITAWLCRRMLLGYAENEAEREEVIRVYHSYLWTSLVAVGATLVAALAFDSMVPASALALAAIAVLNYQLLGPMQKTMAPLLRRDAQRHPGGAKWRQLGYRLTFGTSGVLVSNIAIIGGIVLLYLHG